MVFLPILVQLLLQNRERARKASRELIRERNDTSGGGRVSQTILWPWQFKVNRWNVLSFLLIFHHSQFFYLPCTHAPTHTHPHTRTHARTPKLLTRSMFKGRFEIGNWQMASSTGAAGKANQKHVHSFGLNELSSSSLGISTKTKTKLLS